jgi:DNA-binding IscR family transcriptional regulator
MRRDSRLSAMLHGLLHMAARGKPMTSAELAVCMNTNAVVVRRTMAGLREAGFVQSVKGHGGGWTLACDLSKITLKDIYDALGAPTVLAIGIHLEHPACLVEQAVNRALSPAFGEAERFLIDRLATVTLAQLAEDFRSHASNRHAQKQRRQKHA